jgi:hypothetical protein
VDQQPNKAFAFAAVMTTQTISTQIHRALFQRWPLPQPAGGIGIQWTNNQTKLLHLQQ